MNNILLSIKRQPVKNLLIFMLVLVICTLVNTTFLIGNNMNEIQNQVRGELGYTVTIKGPVNRIKVTDVPGYKEYVSYRNVIESLSEMKGVEYYNANACVDGFFSYDSYNFGTGWYYEFEESNIIIPESQRMTGVSNPKMFEKDVLEIIEGRNFTQEEIEQGSPVCLIYRNSSKVVNNRWVPLEIGDKITIDLELIDWKSEKRIIENKSIELEVIGMIYNNRYKDDDWKNVHGMDKTYFNIYVPNHIFEQMDEYYRTEAGELGLFDGNEYDSSLYLYYDLVPSYFIPRFDLDNQEHLDEFVARAEELLKENDLEDYQIVYSQSRYNKIAPSVDNMKKMAKIVQFAGSLLLMLILSFMISIFIKDRKKEIGIYMALGESKKKLMVRFISEIMVVSIIAILLSFPISNGISSRMMDSLKNTKTVISQKDENGLYDPTMEHTVSIKKVIENMDSSIEPIQVVMLIGIDLVVILISASGALMMVSKTNPKEVLLGDK